MKQQYDQVFLSYRHDSEPHATKVRAFAEYLRGQGHSVALDQFLLDDKAGGPDEGWQYWSETNAERSACVLVVLSSGWISAYEMDLPPRSGCGAACEAAVFRSSKYRNKQKVEHIRVVTLDDSVEAMIPLSLSAIPRFDLGRGQDEVELQRCSRWVSQRLTMPNPAIDAKKHVYVAPCDGDMAGQYKRLVANLTRSGWKVMPDRTKTPAQIVADFQADFAKCCGFVQLLEPLSHEDNLDQRLWQSAVVVLGKPDHERLLIYKDNDLDWENADDSQKKFVAGKETVSAPHCSDFATELPRRLDRLSEKYSRSPATSGARTTPIFVSIRTRDQSKRLDYYDQIYDWICEEPDMAAHLVDNLADPGAPHSKVGYLIFCDSSAEAQPETDPLTTADLKVCATIQSRLKDSTLMPPTAVFFWPPPAPPRWSRLLHVTPPVLDRVVGDDREGRRLFFDRIRTMKA